jgi:DNA-binding protein HU-beta
MKAKITYARLQERVAAAAGISKKEAQSLLKEMAAIVGTGLVSDGKATLSGLGRFKRKVQRTRTGRNPHTGEPLQIPEKNQVDFLPDAQWRRAVNRDFEQMPVKSAPLPLGPAVNTAGTPPVQEDSPGSRTRPVNPATIAAPAPPESTEPTPSPVVADSRATPAPPPQPVETDVATRFEEITVPPPGNARSSRREKKKAAAVALILIAAAVLFLLWPRPPAPPATSRSERVGTLPPETRPPAPSRPAVAEKAVVPPAPVTVLYAEAAQPTPPTAMANAPVPVSSHRVAPGDCLWKISADVYHYAYFWPLIFHANQTTLQNPDTLIVGMQLVIPAFNGRVGQLAEPEFQQLADGYLQVYQAYQHLHHPRAPYYLWVACRLRAHWVPENELIIRKQEDLVFIRLLKGRSLIR